jgi:hypothetical protein
MQFHNPGRELFDFTFGARQLIGESGERLNGVG